MSHFKRHVFRRLVTYIIVTCITVYVTMKVIERKRIDVSASTVSNVAVAMDETTLNRTL